MSFFISVLVFVLFMIGLYMLTNFTLDDLAVDLEASLSPPRDVKKLAIRKQKNKKSGFLVRLLDETRMILYSMGQSNRFILVILVSVILSFVGGFITVLAGNPYLVPAMILGCLSIPFVFVRTYSYAYQKHLRNELELTLSQVTTSYLRTDDIMKAIEENLDSMGSPVRQAFEEFVYQVKFINPNIRQAIDDMKDKIENKIFKEWCECLKKCNQNRTLKHMLVPVVNKYQTLREISGSIQEAINGYRIEYYAIMFTVFINYPIIWFLDKSWFAVLSSTTQGLACTGVIGFVAVLCTIILSFILKPLDYDV